jgi:XTP/dITP diphosphohydrolase
MPRTLVFATRNRGKLAELEALVAPLGLAVVSAAALPEAPEVEEDGASFEENAMKKAREVARACGLPALADDSGLEVDALGGAPGVLSARYAGPGANDRANNARLLEDLAAVPEAARTAHFTCVMAFADPAGALGEAIHVTRGRCDGRLLFEPRGEGGFGYDPLFLVPAEGLTFAELPREAKNRISHRARALGAMRGVLEAYFGLQA